MRFAILQSIRSHVPRLGLDAVEPYPGVPGVEVRLIASVARAKVRKLVLATGKNVALWKIPWWSRDTRSTKFLYRDPPLFGKHH